MTFNPLVNPFDFMVVLMIGEWVGFGIFALYWLIFKDRDRTFFLYFDSDKSCSLETKKVMDGWAKFKTKYFYVDKAKPLMFFRSLGFQNPLLFLKWNDSVPINIIRKTVNPYLMTNEDVNFSDASLNIVTDNGSINEDLKIEIQSDPKFLEELKAHKKYLEEHPEEVTKLDLKVFNKIKQKEEPLISESYHLKENLTPETLKDVMDCKIASNLLKPLSSLDVIMYIVIGLAVGFLLCISLIALGIIPKF